MTYKIISEHDEIREWMESRSLVPVVSVDEEKAPEGEVRMIPIGEENNHTPITWEEFFDHLDTENLILKYDDETGEDSPAIPFMLAPRADLTEAEADTLADMSEAAEENLHPDEL